MAHGPFHAELRQLRTMLAGPMTDADLLHRFVEKRDEAAFAALVRRHGSLVLRVCRNVLRQDADADDAFQATFLVLARKAGSFRKGMSLASWLHGVAYRCSTNLRKSAMRRQLREKTAAAGGRPSESSASGAAWNELQACLHEEVQRLPASVRAAFVLCVLEDKGRAEAAQALGCPEGTLASRLAKARKILQQRLTARGVTMSAALGAAAIATGAASASAVLVNETTTAALAFAAGNGGGAVSAQVLALAKSVLKGMILTKAKLGATLMIAALLGVVAGGTLVAQPSGPELPAKKAVAPDLASQTANDKPEPGGDKPAHVDSRGDALPEAALVRLGSARMRHGGKIHSSKLSPDGKTLATAGDNAVIVWDLESGEAVHRFECDQSESMPDPPLVFAPDGSRLAYVRNLGFGRIWDLRTGKELHRIEKNAGEGVFVDHGKAFLYPARLADSKLHKLDLGSGRITESTSFRGVNFVRISPDGKTMLEVLEKNLTLRELPSGNRLSVWDASVRPNETFSQVGVLYSPDSKTVAIVHEHRQIQVRALPDGAIVASFPLPESAEYLSPPIKLIRRTFRFRLGFSLDSRTLLLATTQGTVHRWDLASGKELPVLAKYPAPIEGAHILPDGRTVITAGSDGVLLKWNTTTGRPQPEPESYEGQIASAYSGDGRFAAIGDARGRVDLWDARSGKAIRTLRREGAVAAHLAFAPDSKLLAMAEPSGTVRSWRIPSGEAGVLHEHRPAKGEWDCNGGIQFSPDGRLLSINDNGPFRLRVIEIATGKELWSDFGTICAAFSADGTTLFVTPGHDDELAGLDSKTGTLKSTMRFEPDPSSDRLRVSSIVPSPDRRTVAVIFGGGILSLRDSRTGLECQ
ncbi:MAG TPA: sigma-70 family RNA polymerase sigma factor, partial [Gemmataceae bacterium]|nr:sigma-70 family RNA polymerase sigma factor [Gemmataceae bacterium]